MITVEEYAHTERQIELCFMAAERANDENMRSMWHQKGMQLVRKLNYKQNGSVAQLDRATDF